MSPIGMILLALATGPPPASAADAVTLRDGKVVLGQVIEPAPRGKVLVVVRRAWAEKNLPARFKAWDAAEATSTKKAKAERIARLEAWKNDRQGEPNDAILAWIDGEIGRLKGDDKDPPRLMLVALNRGDVRSVARRPPDAARKLRQAWRAKFDDAETRPLDELTSALEGRGFAVSGVDPAPIDDLLPVPSESEGRWIARRAATEIGQDRNVRLILHAGVLVPEGTPGEGVGAGQIGGIVKGLLNNAEGDDPLVAKGRELAEKGRVGMMVTTLETAEDISGVTVTITVYGRLPGDRWDRIATRSARVRTSEIRDGEGANIAADPQVQSVFKAAEGLGLAVPKDVKEKGLKIGAATQRALTKARGEIQTDLDALALPVGEPGRR